MKALVRADPRAYGSLGADARLAVAGTVVWTGPRWVAESVLEHLGGYVWSEDHLELVSDGLATAPAST